MRLKLARSPRGANRNRTRRQGAHRADEEEDLAQVERLFSRFWRYWRLENGQSAGGQVRADGEEEGPDRGVEA
ncbi:MAG: hypothetical protein AB1505_16875 [Candidatus Latescibacterota bacterium]